jgi:hypothetical protein
LESQRQDLKTKVDAVLRVNRFDTAALEEEKVRVIACALVGGTL